RDVVGEGRRAVAVGRDLEARVALHGERAGVLKELRVLVRALAVEQERLERGVLLGSYLLGAGRRRRLERDRGDRLVRRVDEERVLERDAEVVEAARVRLAVRLRGDVVPLAVERDAEPIGELLLEPEAEAERAAVARVIPLGTADDELVLGVHVLGDERLDERSLANDAVGMRAARRETAEQRPHGARTCPHERLRAAAPGGDSWCVRAGATASAHARSFGGWLAGSDTCCVTSTRARCVVLRGVKAAARRAGAGITPRMPSEAGVARSGAWLQAVRMALEEPLRWHRIAAPWWHPRRRACIGHPGGHWRPLRWSLRTPSAARPSSLRPMKSLRPRAGRPEGRSTVVMVASPLLARRSAGLAGKSGTSIVPGAKIARRMRARAVRVADTGVVRVARRN